MAQATCTQTLGGRVHFTQYDGVIRVHIRSYFRGDKKRTRQQRNQFFVLLSLGLLLIPGLIYSFRWHTEWAALLGGGVWAVLILSYLGRYLYNRYGVETITMDKSRMKYAAAILVNGNRYVLFCKNLKGNLSIGLKPETTPVLFGPKLIPDSGRRVYFAKRNQKTHVSIQLDTSSGAQLIQLIKRVYA